MFVASSFAFVERTQGCGDLQSDTANCVKARRVIVDNLGAIHLLLTGSKTLVIWSGL